MVGFFTKEGGLTLIELLVVLAIIALLVSVSIVSLGRPKKQANDARRKVDIEQIMKAMDLCYEDSNCGAGAYQYISTTGGANAVPTIGTYFPSVPIDPVDSSPYQYTWIDNSGLPLINKYCVYTKLQAPDTDTWIAASHKGTRIDLTTNPSTVGVNCW
jgi:prepilin-type N-terminal cleavage/methylation domain-containing protein